MLSWPLYRPSLPLYTLPPSALRYDDGAVGLLIPCLSRSLSAGLEPKTGDEHADELGGRFGVITPCPFDDGTRIETGRPSPLCDIVWNESRPPIIITLARGFRFAPPASLPLNVLSESRLIEPGAPLGPRALGPPGIVGTALSCTGRVATGSSAYPPLAPPPGCGLRACCITARSLLTLVLRPIDEKNPTAPTLFLNVPGPIPGGERSTETRSFVAERSEAGGTLRTPMSRANDGYGKLGGGPSGGESARMLILVATYASGRTANVASDVVDPPETCRGWGWCRRVCGPNVVKSALGEMGPADGD